ncbi:MAG: cysteine desulfurase family protein [Bacteroidota bacterium]
MNEQMIYLDNNATTAVDPRVVDQMLPFFYDQPGNAASRTHAFGWQAEEAVKKARRQIAHLIGAEEKEVVFTSGATEAVNLALKGFYETYQTRGRHIITLQTEHKAVLDCCKRLEAKGAEVTYLPVKPDGLLDLEVLKSSIRPDTILVAVMWANNETGTIQQMAEIGAICDKAGVFLFSDATQAVGKIKTHPKAVGVHLLACSAHKLYGPKGIGALYVSQKNPIVKLSAQQDGGGHERGRRSGTLNVPGIVGFGAAATIAAQEQEQDATKLGTWRNQIEQRLLQEIPQTKVNGSIEHRLPQVSNIRFAGIDTEQLLMMLSQQLALSSGSACTSASMDPSHVLKALGLSDEEAQSSIRISLGRFNQPAEIDRAVALLVEAVAATRAMSPAWARMVE